jgi:hypothetical protein
LCGDQTKIKEALLLKFKNLPKNKKVDKRKNLKCFGNCYNYGYFDHWANNCLELKKPKTTKCADSRNKPSQIKGKEEAVEID